MDFSIHCHGFYLSRSLSLAYTWAKEKSSTQDIGAVLMFEVPDLSSFIEKFTGIDLNIPDDDGSADSPAIKKWKEVVSYYRNDYDSYERTAPECLQTLCQIYGVDSDIDYIIGPISNIETKMPISRRPEQSQLCIKSDRLAVQFPFLTSILFFKT